MSKEFLQFWIKKIGWNFGPSGVRALPLAAGINEGGHHFRDISISTEGVIVGFPIFAWAPK